MASNVDEKWELANFFTQFRRYPNKLHIWPCTWKGISRLQVPRSDVLGQRGGALWEICPTPLQNYGPRGLWERSQFSSKHATSGPWGPLKTKVKPKGWSEPFLVPECPVPWLQWCGSSLPLWCTECCRVRATCSIFSRVALEGRRTKQAPLRSADNTQPSS